MTGENPRNTISLPFVAFCRSVYPMPSFNPPGTISKFEYVICRVYLDAQDMGDGCNLIHPGVKDRFLQQRMGNWDSRG